MAKHYELINDYMGFKKGTIVEAKEDTSFVIIVMHEGKKQAIPRAFIKAAPSPAKTSKKPKGISVPTPPKEKKDDTLETEMSMTEARKLAEAMGFTSDSGDTTEKEIKPIEPPKPKPKLKKGQIYLSKITGGSLPSSKIDHVIDIYPDTAFPKEYHVDIPAIDKDYVWDANLLEAMWLSHKLNKRMLLNGYPGTGKTTAVQQFHAWIRKPLTRINGKDGIEGSSFVGYPWATKGGMEWKDGVLPQAMKRGYCLLIDEVFKIPAGIQMVMQSLYEENGVLVLDDKPGSIEDKTVVPHSEFRLFLTDNVCGTGDDFDKFSGTQVQDSSTLDRFGITAKVNYMNKLEEIKMLTTKYPEMDKDVLTKLVTFANLIRTAYTRSEISLTLSPRGLQTICELYEHVPNINRCLQMVFIDKIGDKDEQDAVTEIVKTVYKR